MKYRFLIILTIVMICLPNMVFSQVVTDTPAEKKSLIQNVTTKISNLQQKVLTSTVVTKTAAAIGSVQNSISSYMEKAQAKIAKIKEKADAYKAKAEK